MDCKKGVSINEIKNKRRRLKMRKEEAEKVSKILLRCDGGCGYCVSVKSAK